MKQLLRATPLVILACTAAASVFAYNVWAYGCGRCTLHNMLTLGPLGSGLLAANLLAFAALLVLRLRRRLRISRHRCSCGASLADAWLFCPDCGRQRG